MSGKADTVAGEIVRAISRIGYRNCNDGDHIGVGYGRETCNPAARYLMKKCDRAVTDVIVEIWGISNDYEYEEGLATLEYEVLRFLEAHPELRQQENKEDMRDYRDKDEDVDTYDDDEDDEDDEWDEDEYDEYEEEEY